MDSDTNSKYGQLLQVTKNADGQTINGAMDDNGNTEAD